MIKKFILNCILGFIYIITYAFKIEENKITFISYKSNKLEGNFKLINKYLVKENKYNLNYILMKYENSFSGNIKYLFNCMKQVYYINTSKVILLDYNNYVVSNFKKSGVKVIQVWHATGAIKKFGNDIKRDYKIKNYDYILATSEKWKKPYSTAFNVDESDVIVTGLPQSDILFSEKKMGEYKNYMLNKYPQIKGKKVVLFAPTFRGDPIKDARYKEIDIDYIKESLGDEYAFIYKLHPSLGERRISNDKNIINANKESIIKLFSVTDYLITDYSSIVFDFSILNKPIILFTPDLEEYKKDRGMYIDYESSMPGPICKSEEEVVNVIEKDEFSKERIYDFMNTYFKYKDNNSTKRVGEFIKNLINC